MLRRFVVPLVVVTFALVSAACGPDEDAPMNEFGKQSEEAKKEAREAVKGVFTAAESDCIVDALFERDDITPRQVMDYAEAPQPGGPVEAAYAEEVPRCVDPNVTIDDPGPLNPALRDGMVKGATAQGVTEEEANCLLDALFANGFTARDVSLAGYFPEKEQQLTQKVTEVATHCVSG
ncbi:MAG TPA: hypothetical protein VM345_17600 [Acidimicrobiales bacterium]|jgi:hypothetical protein|nr:hypothetical protein [Acidimicrobiales bacterium]